MRSVIEVEFSVMTTASSVRADLIFGNDQDRTAAK